MSSFRHSLQKAGCGGLLLGGWESIIKAGRSLRQPDRKQRIGKSGDEMAETNKLKILYVLDIMRKTDEQHPLNISQIADRLWSVYGIRAERKSIGRDLQTLEGAGYSIVKCENHNLGWYMVDQDFEEYELKMLVDAVAGAKFMTLEDSRALIRKIKNLATREGEALIDATTVLDPALKIVDSKFKLKFDLVMRAIAERKQISFQYFEFSSGNQKVLKRDGRVYQVSPYYIFPMSDEYFLLANPASHDHATHFKIEMMTNVEMIDAPVRPMREIVELKAVGSTKTIGDYIRENVNMWTGTPVRVTLRCSNRYRHHLMMKFGKDITMWDSTAEEAAAYVTVTDNTGFYQWLSSCGGNVVLEAPEDMRRRYTAFLREMLMPYQTSEEN